MDKKEVLKNVIENVRKGNYSTKINNFVSYDYSKELTDLFDILKEPEIWQIYLDNKDNYSYDDKKKLDQKTDPSTYSLEDCIVYFNWIWYLESGIATGIVGKRIEEGKYLKALERFYELL